MNNTFFRFGGVAADCPPNWLEKVYKWADEFEKKTWPELMDLIAENPIFKERTVGIGVIPKDLALNLSLTGPLLRGSGIKKDLRKDDPYSVYPEFDFEVPIGKNGDTYDRFIVRMEEMRQSAKIIKQAIEKIPDGDVLIDDYKIVPPPKKIVYSQIEYLIHHFKIMSEGFLVKEGEVYAAVEGPKGEIGFYIVSDGSSKPYRFRIRPPSFINLQALEEIAPGHLIADFIALIGTIDIVLGEIDR
jgi:NADH-quinone oxidoreductase subunit D